jgi:tetratricopeptide (TPR) repeat protein
MVQAASGKFKASQASFNRAFELSHSHNEKWIEGTARIYLGITIAYNDKSKIDKAQKTILEGIKILDDRKIAPWSSIGYYNLGMIQAHCGKMRQARINLNNAERMFTEMGMNYWLSLTRKAGAFRDV